MERPTERRTWTDQDILWVAVQTEKRSQERYMELVRAILQQNSALADTFRGMAREEEFHTRRLDDALRAHPGTRTVRDELLDTIWQKYVPSLREPDWKEVRDAAMALRLAQAMEVETSRFLRSLSARAPLPEVRRILEEASWLEIAHAKKVGINIAGPATPTPSPTPPPRA